jgi:hypothetical protein
MMDLMGGDSIDSPKAGYGYSLGEMDVDGLLQTLSHPVRREVIRYFEERSDQTTVSLDELVAYVECQDSAKMTDGLWKTLYQVHLPTLQSQGWLEFDNERETVSYHGHEEAEQLLGEVYAIFKE